MVNLKDLDAGRTHEKAHPGVSYSWRGVPSRLEMEGLRVQRYELSVAFLGNHGTNELVVRW